MNANGWAICLALVAGLAKADPAAAGLALGFVGTEDACWGALAAADGPRPLESIIKATAGCYIGDAAGEWAVKTNWNPVDEGLYRSLIVLSLTDVLQTNAAVKYQEAEELNPLLGKHPNLLTLVALKGFMVFAVGAWSDQHPKGRRAMLITANVVNAYAVAHNASIGVEIRF